MNKIEQQIKQEFDLIKGSLNEKQIRFIVGAKAKTLGYGGIKAVHNATGVAINTIRKGRNELESKDEIVTSKYIRNIGGGRKKSIDKNPNIAIEIEKELDGNTIGDPMSPLTWTTKSLRNLSKTIKSILNVSVGYDVIARYLKGNNYSLQGNKKVIEGGQHIDRDAQFKYIQNKSKEFINEKLPVISVDTKKKELIGNYKNQGEIWCKKGQSQKVNVYDFPSNSKGKAVPYGIYDISNNNGWVSVGISADTGEFSVNSIRSWWYNMGKEIYGNTKKIYINCDGGGSNGSRCRLWKVNLQKLSNEIGLEIHVSHFPPATSKWNKIEHKLFCYITQNWKAKPLDEFVTVVNLIKNTTTTTGLIIKCALDENIYLKGIKIRDEDMEKLNIKYDEFHGDWNYIIYPKED